MNEELAKRILLNMITQPENWTVSWIHPNGKAFSLDDCNVDVLFFSIGGAKECNLDIDFPKALNPLIKEVRFFWEKDLSKARQKEALRINKVKDQLNSLMNKY